MNILKRFNRHLSLTRKSYLRPATPPFLVLFINSICNMKCEHCFYWRSLNQRDDLTRDEIFALSRSLGKIENLNLSGGEPFLRKEFAEICRQFIQHNQVRQIYVPTNGSFTEKTVQHISSVLEEKELDLFVVELSLDGMSEYHDVFRVSKGAFERAMKTYDTLAEVQKRDPRLRIHSISTATSVNMDEIKKLTTFLYERCPQMDHHNLAIIRGDRKNPDLKTPDLKEYVALYQYIRRLWAPRESNRYGAMVEPMLQWAKIETLKQNTQVIPCRAGHLSAVVYANGDVSVCELHKPMWNLRQKSFPEIWNSEEAVRLRQSIAAKECHCTTEVFLWSSIVYQPAHLLRAMSGARVWQKPKTLSEGEKVTFSTSQEPSTSSPILLEENIPVVPDSPQVNLGASPHVDLGASPHVDLGASPPGSGE